MFRTFRFDHGEVSDNASGFQTGGSESMDGASLPQPTLKMLLG